MNGEGKKKHQAAYEQKRKETSAWRWFGAWYPAGSADQVVTEKKEQKGQKIKKEKQQGRLYPETPGAQERDRN